MVKRLTHCRVPGHGTACEVAAEILNRHPRSTERRLALAHENAATAEWRYPGRTRMTDPDKAAIDQATEIAQEAAEKHMREQADKLRAALAEQEQDGGQ